MSLGLKRDKRFHQGYYRLKNPSKYIGKEIPIYRSGIELKFFNWLDNNDNVLEWVSEGIVIPYKDNIKKCWRKYYTDAYVKIKEGDTIKQYIVEIKDIKETQKPNPKSKKKKSVLLFEQCRYETNKCKFYYASEFCKKNNMEFLLLGFSKKDGFVRVDHIFK